MTLVIGILATDGLVIASDSQMSTGATQHPGQKVFVSRDESFVFGLSGDMVSLQMLQTGLAAASLPDDVDAARTVLGQVASEALIPQYEQVRQALGGQVGYDDLPTAEAIVGTFCAGVPHLFRIDHRPLVSDIATGFVSNGWGKPFADHAEVTFRNLRRGGLSVYQGEMLCFRLVEDAIEVSGPSLMLGGPIQIATLSLDGGAVRARRRPNDDPALKDAVDTWVALEAERFRQHQPGG